MCHALAGWKCGCTSVAYRRRSPDEKDCDVYRLRYHAVHIMNVDWFIFLLFLVISFDFLMPIIYVFLVERKVDSIYLQEQLVVHRIGHGGGKASVKLSLPYSNQVEGG
jgi:hypothetical protein